MRHIHQILGQFPENSICQQTLAVLQHGHGILSAAMLTQQQELLAACFEEVCEQVHYRLAFTGSIARHAALCNSLLCKCAVILITSVIVEVAMCSRWLPIFM